MVQSNVYENEQQTWSTRAADYDEVFAHISTQAIQPILDKLGDLKGKRHLDIACGTGHLVHAAAERGAISEGTDLATEMIATARRNYPQHSFQQADAASLPYENDTFDAVTCSFGLSHMVNTLEAMREALRVLKPGGLFAFTLWYGDPDRSEQTALVQAALKKHGDSALDLTGPHYSLRYADEQACRALIRKAGFSKPSFKDITCMSHAKNGQQVYDFIDRLSIRTKRAIENQSPKAQKKIREAVVTGAEGYRKNGRISLRWDALLTTVQKPMPSESEHNATTLPAKYSLFDSVDEMITPAALSQLLGRTVSTSVCTPMDGHIVLSGARLQYVETNADRLVLKRMSPDHDFLMNTTLDTKCRSVKLWQYGLLDELSPQSEHHILAAARDGDGWALLLKDVGSVFYSWDNHPPRNYIDTFLDALAGLHATFWEDDRLRDPEVGLMTPETQMGLVFEGYRMAPEDHSQGPLPEWFRVGWEAMDEALGSETATRLKALIQNPKPILEALKRYPATLVHGDYRGSNLGYLDQPIVIDWQLSAFSLMTIDLIWFISSDNIETILAGEEREAAIAYYRSRLETYLGFQIEETTWQEMLRIGSAIHAFRTILFKGFFYTVGDNPELKAKDRDWVEENARILLDPETWA